MSQRPRAVRRTQVPSGPRLPARLAAGLFALGAGLVACGGAMPPPEPPIHTVDDAEAVLARAEQQVRAVVGSRGQPPQQGPPQPGLPQAGQHGQPAQPAPPPEAGNGTPVVLQAEHAPGKPETPAGDGAERQAARESPCATACRALASMRRATDRLCALAQPSDGRCSAARKRTEQAESDVRHACGAC